MGKVGRKPPSFCAPGPATLEEVKDYPSALLAALQTGDDQGAERVSRLLDALHMGMVVEEDYSGIGSMSMSLRMIQHILRKQGLQQQQQSPFGLVVHRAADKDELCRSVFLDKMLCKWKRTSHVFGDILEKLPAELLQTLSLLLPDAGSSAEQQQQNIEVMDQVLRAHEQEVFKPQSTCWCYLHKKHCALQLHDTALAQLVEQRRQRAALSEDGTWEAGMRPLRVNTAGHTCVGWSSRGSRGGMAHESALPMMVWASSCRSTETDIVFAECTPQFPPGELLQKFPGYEMVTLYVGPERLGFPHRRHRVFNALLRQESLLWVGPPQEMCQHAFDSLFMRSTVLDADTLCVATDGERLQYLERFAAVRGKTLRGHAGSLSSVDVRQLLSPSAVRRYQQYEQQMLEEALPDSLRPPPKASRE